MNNVATFEKRLAMHSPIVIDGGLATQLEAQGHVLDKKLWSAALLESDPQAIVDTHRAYLNAGAEIITTASYQTVNADLVQCSINLANQARSDYLQDNPDNAPPMVAASIGPYGAVLADGSEYVGQYGLDAAALSEFHVGRIELADAGTTDLLACETIPSLIEARALSDLLRNTVKPAWVSFSCRDGEYINDGTSIEEAVEIFRDHPRVIAVGINCTAPQFAESLIGRIRAVLPATAIVAYPNSGELYSAEDKAWSGTVTASDWGAAAQKWTTSGATIVGGCCRTGPEHIRAISESCS